MFFWVGRGRAGGVGFGCGRLFEFEWKGEVGGRLLTCSSFRMGAFSTWALIRGWALIRINTVVVRLSSVLSGFI